MCMHSPAGTMSLEKLYRTDSSSPRHFLSTAEIGKSHARSTLAQIPHRLTRHDGYVGVRVVSLVSKTLWLSWPVVSISQWRISIVRYFAIHRVCGLNSRFVRCRGPNSGIRPLAETGNRARWSSLRCYVASHFIARGVNDTSVVRGRSLHFLQRI